MGLRAAVFTAPLLVTQVAFRRYAGIRATYLQTVRALARVTEVGGYVEAGHSDGSASLSIAIGRELGIHETELLELEYAALMHDIGQLSLRDPIPGGATVLVSRRTSGASPNSAPTSSRDRGARPGGRHRPPADRPVPASDNTAAARPRWQPHHQGGQRLRRSGGQFPRPGRSAAVLERLRLDTGRRVRPGRRRGPQPGGPPLRHACVIPHSLSGFSPRSVPVERGALWFSSRSEVCIGPLLSHAGPAALRERPLFESVLVANRGEIARRVIRTAGGWASRPSPSTPRPTPTCRTSTRQTRPCCSGRPRRRGATSTSPRCSRRRTVGRPGDPPRLRVPVRERGVRPAVSRRD